MESRTGKRWHLWAALAAAAIGLVLVGGGLKSGTDAATQLTPQPDRIIVVPVQVGRDAYGIAMVDMVGKTLWVYEINSRGAPDNRLRLLAARDWQYDQLLAEYNTGQPKPQQNAGGNRNLRNWRNRKLIEFGYDNKIGKKKLWPKTIITWMK
jgi:hypothetical protein